MFETWVYGWIRVGYLNNSLPTWIIWISIIMNHHNNKSMRTLCFVILTHHFLADVSKNYNFKVSLEHQLPTASQKLKTTDECVVSSLIALVTCTGKVLKYLSSLILCSEYKWKLLFTVCAFFIFCPCFTMTKKKSEADTGIDQILQSLIGGQTF